MERLRVPINPFFFGEKMSSECIEQSSALNMSYPHVSFLQMLSGVNRSEEEQDEGAEEDRKELHFQIHQRLHREPNLQRLLEIQSLYSNAKPMAKAEPFLRPAEPQLVSCVTRTPGPSNVGPRERRKRKKSRAPPLAAAKNPQDAENQRMNHIAVERNRRLLMNSHLNTLRSLMPQSFVQRVDQASVVAGAIDFVKELEQLLLSLQAQKRMRAGGDATPTATSSPSASSSSCTNELEESGCHAAAATASGFFISPQYTGYRVSGAHGSGGVDVEATVVQGHVNLKVLVRRGRGQLVRAIAAVEEVGLSVLHLNITSLDACSVLYSLNLKIEEGCKLGSADEIATAVNQIFGYISACCDSY